MNRRTVTAAPGRMKTREKNGEKIISGYFATFSGEYDMGGGVVERVDRNAFNSTLNRDIRALVNHDTSLVLGRTAAKTLTLKVDDNGLYGEIIINDKDQDAMNLYERVKRGDVNQCSFGFDILDEDRQNIGGKTVILLRKVKLYEVSVVTFPAYENTAVEARRKPVPAAERNRIRQWKIDARARLHRKPAPKKPEPVMIEYVRSKPEEKTLIHPVAPLDPFDKKGWDNYRRQREAAMNRLKEVQPQALFMLWG